MTDLMIEEKPASLLNIVDRLKAADVLEEMLASSGGEITPEIDAYIQELTPTTQAELAEKIDSYHFIIERINASEALWKEQADARYAMAKSCARAREQLELRLRIAMGKMGIKELSGNEYRFKLCDARKRLVIQNEREIPATYLMEVIDYVPDKERIKKDLESGQEIPGCKLDGGTSLRKYLNNPNRKKD